MGYRRMTKTGPRKTAADRYEQLTRTLIDELEQGTVPWAKGYETLPNHNAVSGYRYKGINILLLWARAAQRGFTSTGWVTFNQAYEAATGVPYAQRFKVSNAPRILKPGEKSVLILNYRQVEKKTVVNGVEQKERIFMARMVPLFNLDQLAADVPGLDRLREREAARTRQRTHTGHAAADAIVAASGAAIRHGASGAAYSPLTDVIEVPAPEAFATEDGYYATLFHELGHWTGHPSRLNRPLVGQGRVGTEEYAFEELVAELTSAFLCSTTGHQFQSQAVAYLSHWVKQIRAEGPMILLSAARLASKAAEFLAPAPTPAAEADGEEAGEDEEEAGEGLATEGLDEAALAELYA